MYFYALPLEKYSGNYDKVFFVRSLLLMMLQFLWLKLYYGFLIFDLTKGSLLTFCSLKNGRKRP